MTDAWELRRSTTSAAILVGLAAEHGVPPEATLRGTRISTEILPDPDAEITAGQELRLVQNLVADLGHIPGLGLEAGSRYHATTHGIWGFAVISSPTVRKAVEVGVRYLELSFSFAAAGVYDEGEDVRIVVDDSTTPADVREFLMERDLAAIGTIQHDLLGVQLPTKEFTVIGPDRGYAERFLEITGNTPTYDAPRTSLLIDAAMLDLPLPQANPHTAALCERQCAELLQGRRTRRGVAGSVRDLLARRSTVTDLEDVAGELNVSVRTLRRQLTAEGTSYRELAAEVSGVLAEELLAAGLSVEDVAHRLGYSTASAFTHAFRRWHGTTPGSFARTARRLRQVP